MVDIFIVHWCRASVVALAAANEALLLSLSAEKADGGADAAVDDNNPETRVRCFIDGAYMDVCVYDNLCLRSHEDFVFISKSKATDTQIHKDLWLTGGIK